MLERYTSFTRSTAVYPDALTGSRDEINYLIHGLAGEAGEISNYFKKILRKDEAVVKAHADAIIDELGDVLWYAARIADSLDVPFFRVLELNMHKLSLRQTLGALKDHS